MTNPFSSAPLSADAQAKLDKEKLNPQPDVLKLKIESIKCDRSFEAGKC